MLKLFPSDALSCGEVGALKVSALKNGVVQMGFPQPGAAQVRVVQHCTPQIRFVQIGSLEACERQVGRRERGFVEVEGFFFAAGPGATTQHRQNRLNV